MNAKQLIEMASPEGRAYYKETPLYHGTSDNAQGEAILKQGALVPGYKGPLKTNKMYQPLPNRVYATPRIKEAITNAIGCLFGHEDQYNRIKGDYGWLFKIEPPTTDLVVDEDDLGSIAHDLLSGRDADQWCEVTKKLSAQTLSGFRSQLYYLSPQQRERCKKYDDFGHLTIAGKKLATVISDTLMHEIASEISGNLAIVGELKIANAWRIHKDRVKDIAVDGSNFFDIAEQVK